MEVSEPTLCTGGYKGLAQGAGSMAQKEEDCPLVKGGILNALHRLEGGQTPHEGRRKQRWLGRVT